MPLGIDVSRRWREWSGPVQVAALLAVSVAAAPLSAQASAVGSIGVSARVTGALAVTTQDELWFGTMSAPYAPRHVGFTDNGPLGRRGRFTIRADGDTELVMELVVPDAMRNGANPLPLGDWGMRVNTVDADVGGTDMVLVPGVNTTTLRLPGTIGLPSMLYVRLSATASPVGSQVPGSYAATVQVSLTYVGA